MKMLLWSFYGLLPKSGHATIKTLNLFTPAKGFSAENIRKYGSAFRGKEVLTG